VPVRTLDRLRLATLLFLRSQEQKVRLATYDDRLAHAAMLLDIRQASR
jgi:hypothetical protein